MSERFKQAGRIAKVVGKAFLFPWVMGMCTLLWLFVSDSASDRLYQWWLDL